MTEMIEALRPYRVGKDGPWGRAEAAHLARRAGFGAAPARVDELEELGPERAARSLFVERHDPDGVDFVHRAAVRTGGIEAAQGAWVYRMLLGANPVREKLTLFWHGHFATSDRKLDDPQLMLAQIGAFRRLGAGPFAQLLHAIARDPAVLLWLDGNSNRRGTPNENFARELMELFSLGIGNYTEADIKEAARAFTGWHVRRREFWFNEREHDRGDKTVFGERGRFGGEEIVDLCLQREACPRFIATKLFEYYVAGAPSEELRAALGAAYRESGMNTRVFLERLFAARVFFAESSRRALVVPPVDYAIGTLRTLGGSASPEAITRALAEMGQDILRPPSVAGWNAGMAWLTSTTLIARYRFAERVLGEGRDAARIAWDEIGGADAVVARLFPEGLSPAVRASVPGGNGDDGRAAAAACVQLPEYQFV